jgi:hypothetical protein
LPNIILMSCIISYTICLVSPVEAFLASIGDVLKSSITAASWSRAFFQWNSNRVAELPTTYSVSIAPYAILTFTASVSTVVTNEYSSESSSLFAGQRQG